MYSSTELTMICYVSSSAQAFTKDELKDLLRHARAANEKRDVTGVLLYSDGTFMQIIEGPRSEVEGLYGKVVKDPRHRGIVRLVNRPIEQRYFGDWSMACREMSAEEREAMGIYSDLLNESDRNYEFRELLPDWVMRLVEEFRRINR